MMNRLEEDYEDALREVQRMALEIICIIGEGETPNDAVKTLGGIYNYCETVLRHGRRK